MVGYDRTLYVTSENKLLLHPLQFRTSPLQFVTFCFVF